MTNDMVVDTTAKLTIRNLRVTLPGPSKKDPRKQILDGVDLTLRPGKISGIAGESGSGKTMTGLAVLGLLPPGAGQKQVVVDNPAWIAVAFMLVRPL